MKSRTFFTLSYVGHKFLFASIFILCLNNLMYSQYDCYFDQYKTQAIANYPEYEQIFETNDSQIEQTIVEEGQQLLLNNTVYTIPVVFHVLHIGESSSSNILTSKIDDALDQLNADFRNMTEGYDVKMEFCYAQRDPLGNVTDGITRTDASGIPYYTSLGMAQNLNEFDLKAPTGWPNSDYINIWIVNDIANSATGSNLAGYGTFPGTAPEIDGIVLRYDVVGNPLYNKVISHEMGHFFQLYHTFENFGLGGCSPNNACDQDPSNDDTEQCCRNTGDKCCDTPSHKETVGCPTTIVDPCDPDWLNVINNHMSYTDNDCRVLFSEDQGVRMRCALLELRTELTLSLGCEEPCPTSTSNAEFALEESFGNFYMVTAVEDNAEYIWTVGGVQQGTDSQVEFLTGGLFVFDICLIVTKDGCSNKSCKTLTNLIESECDIDDPCEIVRNGDFKINNIEPATSYHYSGIPDLSILCGWSSFGTPFICDNNYNGQYGGMVGSGSEAFTTYYELDLIDGALYNVEFEYFPISTEPSLIDLHIGFTKRYRFISSLINVISLYDLQCNTVQSDDYPAPCLTQEEVFIKHNETFTYNSSIHGKYLFISTANASGERAMLIKNISISQCAGPCSPDIDIQVEQEDCAYTFTVLDQGEADSYEWTIINNPETYEPGNQLNYMFVQDGEYEICVTANCGENQSASKCVTIIVDCTGCKETYDLSIDEIECNPNEDPLIDNFSLNVNKGFKPCDTENNLPATSYEIDKSNLEFDIINFALTNEDLLLGEIYICAPNGDVYCYTLRRGEESKCEFCMSVGTPQFATCIDTNPFDEISNYGGTFEISNIPPGASFCGSTASIAGYSDDDGKSDGNGGWSFDYEINTSIVGNFNTSVLICFQVGQDEYCFTVDISPAEPCPDPVDCLYEFPEPEIVECSNVYNDWDPTGVPLPYIAGFNISGRTTALPILNEGYEVCSLDFGTLENGTIVNDNSDYTQTNPNGNTHFEWNFDIEIPCSSFESEIQEYELTVFLCGPNGEEVCITYILKLECELCRFAKKPAFIENGTSESKFTVFPNPATNTLKIDYSQNNLNNPVEVEIISFDGRKVLQEKISGKINSIDVSTLKSGFYIIVLNDENGLIDKQKIIIVE